MTIHADNIISLRTVIFKDDGVLGYFVLLPPIPDHRPDGHLHQGVCWVYKRYRSIMDRLKGCYRKHEFASVLRGMKPLRIRLEPVVSFLWSDSGHSVAVVVDDEPMGFPERFIIPIGIIGWLLTVLGAFGLCIYMLRQPI